MNFHQALDIAADLRWQMRPFCHRCEIGGSINRLKDEVKDIEIVVIPKWEERPISGDLFGNTQPINLLYEAMIRSSGITWIKTGTDEIIRWDIKPEGSYWRGILGVGIKADFFLCDEETWGYQMMLRTGSGSFNKAVAQHGLRTSTRYTIEALRGCRTQKQAFARLGLQWIPPWERTGPEALKPLEVRA